MGKYKEWAIVAVSTCKDGSADVQAMDTTTQEPDESILLACRVTARRFMGMGRMTVEVVGSLDARKPGQPWGKARWREICHVAIAKHHQACAYSVCSNCGTETNHGGDFCSDGCACEFYHSKEEA